MQSTIFRYLISFLQYYWLIFDHKIIATLMVNPEDSAPNFGIFKFMQSISTFAGYFGLLKLKIQIQVTILGRTLNKY